MGQPSDEYIAVHRIERDGRVYSPGDSIVVADPAQLERLLRLGAIMKLPEYARRDEIQRQRRLERTKKSAGVPRPQGSGG